MLWPRKSLPLVLIVLTLLRAENVTANPSPTIVPKPSAQPTEPEKGAQTDKADVQPSPVVLQQTNNTHRADSYRTHPSAKYKEGAPNRVSIVGLVHLRRIKKDFLDYAYIGFGGLLAVTGLLQVALLYFAAYGNLRPRVKIRTISLSGSLEDLRAAEIDPQHHLPSEKWITLYNTGVASGTIHMGFFTLRLGGNKVPIWSWGEAAHRPTDDIAKGKKVKPGFDTVLHKPSDLHLQNLDDISSGKQTLWAVGFIWYGWFRRRYKTGFCRRYDPSVGAFVKVDNPDHEFED
jgi:hypothetical protein